jgi:hypothetical protein
MGTAALRATAAISECVGIGYYTTHKVSANYNVAVGSRAGYELLNGANNSFFGHSAGYNITTGASNVFIGYEPFYFIY